MRNYTGPIYMEGGESLNPLFIRAMEENPLIAAEFQIEKFNYVDTTTVKKLLYLLENSECQVYIPITQEDVLCILNTEQHCKKLSNILDNQFGVGTCSVGILSYTQEQLNGCGYIIYIHKLGITNKVRNFIKTKTEYKYATVSYVGYPKPTTGE